MSYIVNSLHSLSILIVVKGLFDNSVENRKPNKPIAAIPFNSLHCSLSLFLSQLRMKHTFPPQSAFMALCLNLHLCNHFLPCAVKRVWVVDCCFWLCYDVLGRKRTWRSLKKKLQMSLDSDSLIWKVPVFLHLTWLRLQGPPVPSAVAPWITSMLYQFGHW